MMQMCSVRHDEVVYESRYCPVCELEDRLKTEIKEWRDKAEDFERQLDQALEGR